MRDRRSNEIIVDPKTGEVRLKEGKKYRVHEKNTLTKRKNPSTPPIKQKGAGKKRPLEAILDKENTPEKIKQAEYIINRSPSELSHKAELLGLVNAQEIYQSLINIAKDESLAPEVRGPFLKFIADRTVAKRATKLLSLPTIPLVKTLEDIGPAVTEIFRLMKEGEITHDEGESLARSYNHLANIMSAMQVKEIQNRLAQMQESVLKTATKESLLGEVDDRLMEYDAEERKQKFGEWFVSYLDTESLLGMLGVRMKSADDKIKILQEITRMCK